MQSTPESDKNKFKSPTSKRTTQLAAKKARRVWTQELHELNCIIVISFVTSHLIYCS